MGETQRITAATDPGEEVHWQATVTKSRSLGALAAILTVFVAWPATGWLLVVVPGVVLSKWIVLLALILAILAAYGVYRVLAPHHETVTYAATDRRLLAVPGSGPDDARSIDWEEVTEVTIPPARHGRHTDGICVQTDDVRLSDGWAPFSCSMYVNPLSEPKREYQRLLAARRRAEGVDPAERDVDDVQWDTSRSAVSERVEEYLDADETVRWRSRTDEDQNRTLTWIGVAVLGPFAFAVGMVVTGVVVPLVADPLPFWPSVAGSLLFAAGSVLLLVRAQRTWHSGLEYVVTDRRLFATRGDPEEWPAVSWDEVADIERFNDTIFVETSGKGVLQFQRVPDVEDAVRYLERERKRRS